MFDAKHQIDFFFFTKYSFNIILIAQVLYLYYMFGQIANLLLFMIHGRVAIV